MPPPDDGSSDWASLARRIDQAVAEAIAADITRRDIQPAEIAAGFSELALLRVGEEPDYETRGLATAYGFAYLAQRVTSLVAALLAAPVAREGLAILDIGSGTGAASIALEVAGFRGCTVVAVEPSAEMRSFLNQDAPANQRRNVAATLDLVLAGHVVAGAPVDLLILSATLPYGWNPGPRSALVAWGLDLRNLMAQAGCVAVVEPAAKASLLDLVSDAFRGAGISCSRRVVEELAPADVWKAFAWETKRMLDRMTDSIVASGQLSHGGSALMSMPWAIQLSAARPDVLLLGTVGPLAERSEKPPFVRGRALTRAEWARRHAPATPSRPAGRERGIPALAIGAAILGTVLLAAGLAWWFT